MDMTATIGGAVAAEWKARPWLGLVGRAERKYSGVKQAGWKIIPE